MLVDLQRWGLEVSRAGVDWRALQEWPLGISPQERRATAFQALRQIVPLDVPKKLLRPVPLRVELTLKGAAVASADVEGEFTRGRRQIYKSIRRHYARDWGISSSSFKWLYDDELIIDGSGCILAGDPNVSTLRHGFQLWRTRFENAPRALQVGVGVRGLGLGLSLQGLTLGAELFSEPRAWGVFALTCLLADCSSANQWNSKMRKALNGVESGPSRRLVLLPLVQELADHLSPMRRAWPAGLTAVSHSRGASGAQARVILFRELWGANS